MDVSDEHMKQIKRRILVKIVEGLERDQITETVVPEIADFVLDKVSKAQDHNALITYLDELSSRWPIFDNIEQLERGEMIEVKEDQVESKVLELAKSGQVDAAINLAKTVTEK